MEAVLSSNRAIYFSTNIPETSFILLFWTKWQKWAISVKTVDEKIPVMGQPLLEKSSINVNNNRKTMWIQGISFSYLEKEQEELMSIWTASLKFRLHPNSNKDIVLAISHKVKQNQRLRLIKITEILLDSTRYELMNHRIKMNTVAITT